MCVGIYVFHHKKRGAVKLKKEPWVDKYHSDEEFAVKLGEEVGEVMTTRAREIRDGMEKDVGRLTLQDDLEHVEFIARCWREQLAKQETGT
jgi:ABC-type sulfate transport system substrate-binding protein